MLVQTRQLRFPHLSIFASLENKKKAEAGATSWPGASRERVSRWILGFIILPHDRVPSANLHEIRASNSLEGEGAGEHGVGEKPQFLMLISTARDIEA